MNIPEKAVAYDKKGLFLLPAPRPFWVSGSSTPRLCCTHCLYPGPKIKEEPWSETLWLHVWGKIEYNRTLQLLLKFLLEMDHITCDFILISLAKPSHNTWCPKLVMDDSHRGSKPQIFWMIQFFSAIDNSMAAFLFNFSYSTNISVTCESPIPFLSSHLSSHFSNPKSPSNWPSELFSYMLPLLEL